MASKRGGRKRPETDRGGPLPMRLNITTVEMAVRAGGRGRGFSGVWPPGEGPGNHLLSPELAEALRQRFYNRVGKCKRGCPKAKRGLVQALNGQGYCWFCAEYLERHINPLK